MGQSTLKIVMGFVLAAAFCGAARAQAVTEYSSMASKSATVGNRANGITKEIGGVWANLDKTIKSQDPGSSQGTTPSRPVKRAPIMSPRKSTPTVAAVATIHEDPSLIQPGLSYEEVIRRFGPPSFAVSTDTSTKTLTYPGKDGDIDVELLDGRVTKVATAKAPEVAVVRPK